MEFLNDLLPIIIYFLLIILIIILIVLSIKAIKMMNKMQEVVDNVDRKVKTFDRLFDLIGYTTDKLYGFSDRIIEIVSGAFEKLFKKKKKKKKIEEED